MHAGKLSGKVALVTGASSGIGEATALALAAEGARVAIAARRVQRLNDLAERIRQAGGEALPIEADVADEAQSSKMVGRVLRECGRLDLLLNVAGIGVAAPFQNTTTACIEPGAVKTEFISHMREDVRKSVEQRLGDMEQLESEDIAAAILYAVTQPRRVNINILTLYPTQQA